MATQQMKEAGELVVCNRA